MIIIYWLTRSSLLEITIDSLLASSFFGYKYISTGQAMWILWIPFVIMPFTFVLLILRKMDRNISPKDKDNGVKH